MHRQAGTKHEATQHPRSRREEGAGGDRSGAEEGKGGNEVEVTWKVFRHPAASAAELTEEESGRKKGSTEYLLPFYPEFTDDCQIPDLAVKYTQIMGFRRDGTFVEVGAFDGRTWSNTWALATVGWIGHLVEPVPDFARMCARHHEGHPGVSTHNIALGHENAEISMRVGGALSTCSSNMSEIFSGLAWSRDYINNSSSMIDRVPMRTLDYFLQAVEVKPAFELLVIDVEGFELEVLRGFSIEHWRPQIVIVEIEDRHADFQAVNFLQARFRETRDYFRHHHYHEYWRDDINTIFVRESA